MPLKRGKYQYRRLDGTMSVPMRERAITDFEERHDTMVLLVSLKAAALGVNLTAANHVVLMDLWWNPTIEEQVWGWGVWVWDHGPLVEPCHQGTGVAGGMKQVWRVVWNRCGGGRALGGQQL